MKKMWKRFVSLLLACTLLAGMLPLSASAAEKPAATAWITNIINDLTEQGYEDTMRPGVAPMQVGSSDVFMYMYQKGSWVEDGGGIQYVNDLIVIFQPGNGAGNHSIPDYTQQNPPEWSESKPSAVYFADGVTGIGNYAFASQPSLNNVVFQDASSLTYIGQRAFYDDDNAVFTDEGNLDASSTIDLSNVKKMGEYAFYNCDRIKGVELSGNITAEEGDGTVENKIPNHAFNNSGLQTVNIPEGIVTIGDGAFAHTSLSGVGELVLPDGLQTIGDNAFVATMGEGDTSSGITSLTIPSTVTAIGVNAFSGRRNLKTVTVEDDKKADTELILGDGAFGTNEFTAYSTMGSFTDEQGTTYEGLMGTVFHLPDDLVETFINGKNCYTGSIEPMHFIETVEPTCEEQGYHLYETRMEGAVDAEGNPVVLYYRQWIDALGHDWDEENPVTVPATCETPSYTYEPCTHGCGEIYIIDPNVEDALGHDYQVNENGGVVNPGIKESNNAPTRVTYTCQHFKEGEGNLHDGSLPASYTWSIPATTLRATTSDTLADLQLPGVTGDTQASLVWADGVDTTAKLQAGTYQYQVKLVVSNDSNFKPYTDASFTIEVNVEKTKLDFSDVHFENSTRWIGGNTPVFSVEGMPEGTYELKTEYKKKGDIDAEWTEETPEENSTDDTGEYLVRYTFGYNSTIYDLVTNDPDLSPPDGYVLVKTKDNEGTITGDYRVAQMTMKDVSIRAIDNLTFNGTSENIGGTPQRTVQLDGVLTGSNVTFSWTENGVPKEESVLSTTSSTFSGASITNAGTYEVTVRVENGQYEPVDRKVTVNIAKQTLTAPQAIPRLRYEAKQLTGVLDSTDSRYTVLDNKQTNAGTYTAKAKVINPSNYQWPASVDPDENGTAEISWQILHRLLAKPTIPINQYQYEEGTYRQPVTTTSQDIAISYEDDKLVATFRGETAYTATNAKETNAEDYTVTVHLENQNYRWADQTSADFTLNWTINRQQINAPTITAPDAAYDGVPYDGEVTLKHSSVSGSNGSSEGIIDLKTTSISYYTAQNDGNPLQDTPVNAGTYYAGVESDGWAFVDGKVKTNYQIIRGARDPFSITKATATIEFGQKEVPATYTAQGTPLQKVTVNGLQGDDATKPPTEIYSVTYTYKYRENSTTEWEDVSETTTIDDPDTFVFTDVGEYQITAKWGEGSLSDNYQADPATYTLTITQANDQSITLTPDEKSRWTAASDSAPAKYTIEYGQDATFTVTGKAALDNAEISYAVKGDSDVVSVDTGNGTVTIEQAGTATITVTAADTANVKGASVEYTVTVKKAKPTVNTGLTDNKLEVSYTGQPIEGYDKATATADVVKEADPPTGAITYTFYTDAGCSDADKVTTGGGDEKNVPIKVGTYYMQATYPGNENYLPAESEVVTVTVTEAELTVDAKGYTDTYNGGEHDPASITVTGVDGTSFEEDNYTVSYIEKGSDGEAKPDVDNSNWNPGLKVKDVADSGDYWFKVVINEGDSYAPYIGSVTVDIDPKPLTVTKTVIPTKVYDGTVDATKNVTFQSINTGIVGETVEADRVSAVYDSPNANVDNFITITYQLTAEDGTNLANYSLDGKTVTPGEEMSETVDKVGDTKVGITPASITVAIKDQKKVYDGSAPTVSNVKDTDWEVTAGQIYQLVSGTEDNLGITLSIDSGSKNAGTYAITGGWTNSNYTVTFTGSWTDGAAGTYTIEARPIKVEIGNAEGFYGDAPDVTMGDKVILEDVTNTEDASEDGLVQGEDIHTVFTGLTLRTNAIDTSPVGSYRIYPVNNGSQIQVLTTPTRLGNYNVTFTNEGTYTVKPRPITITIEDQESDYGCEIAQLTYNGTLSNTYTGSNKNVVFVGDDEDELGITLSTTAKKGSDAGTYPISGMVTNTDLAKNYMITWEGQTPYQGQTQQATYTVEKADLAVEFTNETVNISMGGQVENPLKYFNASNGNEDLSEKPDGVTVTYSSSKPSVAKVDPSTGEVTLVGVGDATITANVTGGGKNFNEGASATYELHVAQDGGLRTTVTPVAGLTYTGKMQDLVTYTTSPEGATVTFTVTAQESGDQYQIDLSTGIPQALDAGTYKVSWRTTLEGYREETGSITVTVAKADPSKGFTPDSVSVAYEENKIYDSTEDTILQVEVGYASEAGNSITYLSDDTQVARVEDNNLETILLNSMGTAHISARFAETENFQEQTVFFTLTVGQATTMINYTAEDYKVTYDGQAHGSRITVTSPSEYTIKYSDNQGASYDLDESPAITDAGSRTIYFQIQADGYQSAIGTQTVTVEPKPIKEEMIAGIAESYTYTGKGITFDDAISVHDEGVLLKQNTDYTIDYGDNKEVGTGFVTITGMGNYTGEVIEHFDIIPVDGSSGMTASIDPAYGTYDPDGNTATVTVTHQTGTDSHEVTLTAENASYTITATDLVTGDPITERGATGTGNTLTFTKPAIYDITLTLTGDHRGEFHLSYTLLPLSNEDGGLTLTVDDETQKVFTYGDEIDSSGAAITVTADGNIVTDQCTLTYEYTGFDQTTVSGDYSPSVLKNAGVYTVTATPTEGSTITGTGTFTFLILQRDLAKATLAVNDTDLVFNHDEKKPDVTVTVDGNAQPTKDTDYTITYYNNVNASNAAKAVVTATGNNFTGSQTADFTIAPKPITGCVVENIPEQYYTGNAVIPPVTITDGNYTLILGYDYTTACADKGPGEATVTITGTGNYRDQVEKTFTIKSEGAPEPSERFDLVVTPSQWTWGDDLTNLDLSVTFGTDKELQFGTDYTIKVDEKNFDGVSDSQEMEDVLSYIKGLKPDEYTITATGVGAYNGSTDTETVTIQKIQPTVTVTATPNSLSGGGKVTLTLKGEKLPDGTDLKNLLKVTAKNDNDVTQEDLHIQWPEDGSLTAELTLPNTNETYTFALSFVGDEYYEPASSNAMVVVGQQTSGGGGGSDPGDQPADPDDTGVSDWLNTKDHLAYLAGYPGGTFGPDQNMTRAEAAQMFYNLLLEKDVEITVEFEDVPADAWYAKPVNTLASLGILSGVGNGRFDPERSITRAEFTVIAMKFANTSGGGVNIFSDVNEDDWFYSAVVDSTQYGWINGYPDGTFRPEATISRAEVTVIVNHMLGRAADRPYVIAHEEELNTFGDVNRGHWGYFHVAEATNAHEYHTEDGTESWTGLS